MEQIKVKGFLLAESMTALTIAILGIATLFLIVGESRALERQMELKTDRTYAWHVLRQQELTQLKVHDRIYELRGDQSVYDATAKETYYIKK